MLSSHSAQPPVIVGARRHSNSLLRGAHKIVKSKIYTRMEKQDVETPTETKPPPTFGSVLRRGLNALASDTRYVNGVTGNNANNGKTAATAYRTIGHAISMSTSGDSIIVAVATYKNLNIPFDLTIAGSAARTTRTDGGHSADS